MPQEKSPAFQCYVNDLLNDINVQMMRPDEFGVYWKLICYSWVEDGLPNDMKTLESLGMGAAGMIALAGNEQAFNERSTDVQRPFDEIWRVVQLRFQEDDQGRLRNRRVEAERDKQRSRREQQSEAGRRSGQARREATGNQSNARSTSVEHPLNSSSSSSPSSSTSNKESRTKELSDEVWGMTDNLIKLVLDHINYKMDGTKRRKWAEHIEKMVRLDGITIERQHLGLVALTSHWEEPHWPEIRSGKTWREKFDKLEAAMRRAERPASKSGLAVGQVNSTQPTLAEYQNLNLTGESNE